MKESKIILYEEGREVFEGLILEYNSKLYLHTIKDVFDYSNSVLELISNQYIECKYNNNIKTIIFKDVQEFKKYFMYKFQDVKIIIKEIK